jgi:hypothetical protein
MSELNLPDPSGFRAFQPISSNPRNGELITLCQILEATSGTGYDYQLSNYVAADKPGTVVIKNGSQVLKTLTLSYDSSNNLTSIVRS